MIEEVDEDEDAEEVKASPPPQSTAQRAQPARPDAPIPPRQRMTIEEIVEEPARAAPTRAASAAAPAAAVVAQQQQQQQRVRLVVAEDDEDDDLEEHAERKESKEAPRVGASGTRAAVGRYSGMAVCAGDCRGEEGGAADQRARPRHRGGGAGHSGAGALVLRVRDRVVRLQA